MELIAAKTHAPSYALLYRPPVSNRSPPHSPRVHLSPISLKLKNLQFRSCFRKPIFAVPPSRLRPILCGDSSKALAAEKKSWIEAAGEAVSTAFPVWVALGCLLGLLRPSSFNWVQRKWTGMGITLTMLGMGMTLSFDDLRGALAMPKELLAGLVLQYSVIFLSLIFLFSFSCCD